MFAIKSLQCKLKKIIIFSQTGKKASIFNILKRSNKITGLLSLSFSCHSLGIRLEEENHQ